eukprot:TRINITY_DN22667_c0_g1_i1.p2 TRINITY_DN22667_c0_g1~~TRINITY_DN22667_c0_g1_i1.p2  ORF type:complete len:153 (-),score=48.61 TRINITY_DN22667_c0_g1_i1:33-491(-)
MVGPPASGKSSFAKTIFVSQGYVRVNRDTLKTKEKCMKVAKEELANGKSVVIDNTNPSPDARKEFINLAEAKGIPCRCFVMDTDIKLAHHLNLVREKATGGQVSRIPDIAYNMFKSKFKYPDLKEGFTEIKKVEWRPHFESDLEKQFFLERT